MKRILFLTTSHHYNDDRIFYHQAKSLREQGHTVKIVSLTAERKGVRENIEIEASASLDKTTTEKLAIFNAVCKAFQPEIIICSEPLAVIAAHRYGKNKAVKIIYDVTEWYPSKRMLQHPNWFGSFLKLIKFSAIQFYAGWKSSHFIFGEQSKKFPLAYVFRRKPSIVLPYYPDHSYISRTINKLDGKSITLGYTGRISKRDGIENFFNAAHLLRRRNPGLQVILLIMGRAQTEADGLSFEKLVQDFGQENIKFKEPVPLEKFTESFAEADICLDLREKDFESTRCLPIKLFYYAGAGKPVIYSNLKATRQHIDVSKFGYLVEPDDARQVANAVEHYLRDQNHYDHHAHQAVNAFETQYNWNEIKSRFLKFVEKTNF